MRALAALLCVAASCGPSDGARALVQRVPIVGSAAVLAGEDVEVPPHIVTLDAYGTIRVADAPRGVKTLADLGRRDVTTTRTDLDDLRAVLPQPEREIEWSVGGVRRHDLDGARPIADDLPTRRGQVIGEMLDDAGTGSPFLVAAAPTARAVALVDVLGASGGILAVAHRGVLRALRIEFGLRAPGESHQIPWLEVRIGHAGLEIEGVPDSFAELPWSSGSVDAKELGRVLADVRARRGIRRVEVDVLVSDTTSVQRLIDVLVRLDEAGVRAVVLGRAPVRGTDEAMRRGRRVVAVVLGQPQAVGDLDKAVIRRLVKEHVPQVRACYEEALARDRSLAGTVNTQFFIAPNGNVSQANASGVSTEVAACVARVLKSIVFPKPKGGGGVQVNYPFNLRS